MAQKSGCPSRSLQWPEIYPKIWYKKREPLTLQSIQLMHTHPRAFPSMAVIEGVHLARGAIAAGCCARTLPQVETIGLSWIRPFQHTPPMTHIICESPSAYYSKFAQFLDTYESALVVPCTIRGHIIANHFRSRHDILGEPYLTTLAAFDKLSLRERHQSLTAHMLPTYEITEASIPYPVLAKPRVGHSSKSQFLLNSPSDYCQLKNPELYFLEPLLPVSAREYSLTVVSGPQGRKRMCIRRLQQAGGVTTKAGRIVSEGPAIFSNIIASRLEFDVIFNLQFAWVRDRGIVFDLNPRFGYSELYRSCFGFNFIAGHYGVPSEPLTGRTILDQRDAFKILIGS